MPTKSDDPIQRRMEALQRALDATTIERPGCPWDEERGENDERESELNTRS